MNGNTVGTGWRIFGRRRRERSWGREGKQNRGIRHIKYCCGFLFFFLLQTISIDDTISFHSLPTCLLPSEAAFGISG
jgi:hypothetical protein